jgi:hypothetical protein
MSPGAGQQVAAVSPAPAENLDDESLEGEDAVEIAGDAPAD